MCASRRFNMTMTDVDDQQAGGTLPLVERAFVAACWRLQGTEPTANETDAFAPLAEVLWWAVSLDEGYRARDGERYVSKRDADRDGQLWQGVRFARNRAGHQRLAMVQRRPGAELGTLVLGVSRLRTVTELVWRPASELPSGPSHPDDKGRHVYEQALQGWPVRDTIDALRRWFDRAAGREPDDEASSSG
jgi:hypothetical protein